MIRPIVRPFPRAICGHPRFQRFSVRLLYSAGTIVVPSPRVPRWFAAALPVVHVTALRIPAGFELAPAISYLFQSIRTAGSATLRLTSAIASELFQFAWIRAGRARTE